jgi:hypothetical protein
VKLVLHDLAGDEIAGGLQGLDRCRVPSMADLAVLALAGRPSGSLLHFNFLHPGVTGYDPKELDTSPE